MLLWEDLRTRASFRIVRNMLRVREAREHFKIYRFNLKKRSFSDIDEYRNACIGCGNRERYHLEFHHMNPFFKETDITSLPRDYPEILKCVILCANCHSYVHRYLLKKIHMDLVDKISAD